MTGAATRLLRRLRVWLTLFIIATVLSGLTAFPLQTELDWLTRWLGVPADASPDAYTGVMAWLVTVRDGLRDTYARHPFIAYGTDWLAFAHLLIALLFIGPWRDPVRNAWVVTWGLWACALVIPLALICGEVRGIPWGWRLIDCSFGVFGAVPLWMARRLTQELARGAGRGNEPPAG